MNKQEQAVGEGAVAIQASRDVIVHSSMSAAQMTEIMVGIGKQLNFYQGEALRVFEDRLASFRDEILKKFTKPGPGNPEAFRDPDFQFMLKDAQIAYGRSGDDVVKDTLVDIIARRSLEDGRSRIAVTLNDAATKVSLLTANEFAELSLVYTLCYTQHHGVDSLMKLCNYINDNVIPFIKDVSRENSSYWHLEAQSCARIDIGVTQIEKIFKLSYGGVLGRGFTRSQLDECLPSGKKHLIDTLIIRCLNDGEKLQPGAITREVFQRAALNTGLNVSELDIVWNLFEGTMPSQVSDLVSFLAPHVPDIALLFDVWQDTPLKNLKLNSVGIAIGHANAVRVTGFDAPLSVWIN